MSLYIFGENTGTRIIAGKGEMDYTPDYDADHVFYINYAVNNQRLGTNALLAAIGEIAAASQCDTLLLKHSFSCGTTEEIRVTTRSPEDRQAMQALIEALPMLNGSRWAHTNVMRPKPVEKPRALILHKPDIAA